MGKRKKAAKKVEKKMIPKLDTMFDCPFCSHAKTIEVKLQSNKQREEVEDSVSVVQNLHSELPDGVPLYSIEQH